MPTSFKDIENNSATIIDWAATIINDADIEDLAKSIPKNTSATEISFELSNLTDNEFSALTDAILKRPVPFGLINIRSNLLTDMSIPSIIKLIESKKSENINIEDNKFSNTSDNKKQLKDAILASGGKVNLITNLDLKSSQLSSSGSSALFAQRGVQKNNLNENSVGLDAHRESETLKAKEECKEHTPPRKES